MEEFDAEGGGGDGRFTRGGIDEKHRPIMWSVALSVFRSLQFRVTYNIPLHRVSESIFKHKCIESDSRDGVEYLGFYFELNMFISIGRREIFHSRLFHYRLWCLVNALLNSTLST